MTLTQSNPTQAKISVTIKQMENKLQTTTMTDVQLPHHQHHQHHRRRRRRLPVTDSDEVVVLVDGDGDGDDEGMMICQLSDSNLNLIDAIVDSNVIVISDDELDDGFVKDVENDSCEIGFGEIDELGVGFDDGVSEGCDLKLGFHGVRDGVEFDGGTDVEVKEGDECHFNEVGLKFHRLHEYGDDEEEEEGEGSKEGKERRKLGLEFEEEDGYRGGRCDFDEGGLRVDGLHGDGDGNERFHLGLGFGDEENGYDGERCKLGVGLRRFHGVYDDEDDDDDDDEEDEEEGTGDGEERCKLGLGFKEEEGDCGLRYGFMFDRVSELEEEEESDYRGGRLHFDKFTLESDGIHEGEADKCCCGGGMCYCDRMGLRFDGNIEGEERCHEFILRTDGLHGTGCREDEKCDLGLGFDEEGEEKENKWEDESHNFGLGLRFDRLHEDEDEEDHDGDEEICDFEMGIRRFNGDEENDNGNEERGDFEMSIKRFNTLYDEEDGNGNEERCDFEMGLRRFNGLFDEEDEEVNRNDEMCDFGFGLGLGLGFDEVHEDEEDNVDSEQYGFRSSWSTNLPMEVNDNGDGEDCDFNRVNKEEEENDGFMVTDCGDEELFVGNLAESRDLFAYIDSLQIVETRLGSEVDFDEDEDEDGDGEGCLDFHGDDDDFDNEGEDSDFALCWDCLHIDEDQQETNEHFEWEEVVDREEEGDVEEHMSEVDINAPLTSRAWEYLLERNFGQPNTNLDQDNDDDYPAEYETLFGQFTDNEETLKGSPPTSRSVVENLPSLHITQADVESKNAICAVCKDDISVEEGAKLLPCKHHYHKDCIIPWLNIRNTCPVCRFELPTDDPEYERHRLRNDHHYVPGESQVGVNRRNIGLRGVGRNG